MGKAYIDSVEVGSFEPQTEGTSGNILLNSTNLGTFTLAKSGYVYLDTVQIGVYSSLAPPLEDARYRTKVYLQTHISNSYLTKDDDNTQVSFTVMFANPNYLIELEFYAASNPVDLIFCIGTPDSVALPVGVGYIENMPITIWTIDKTGITGTKLRWKAERELRRICEDYPHGSLRTWDRLSDNEQHLGGTVLYSVNYIMRYKRYA